MNWQTVTPTTYALSEGGFHGQLMEQFPISRASLALDITLAIFYFLGD
jgi:hypothetical protein